MSPDAKTLIKRAVSPLLDATGLLDWRLKQLLSPAGRLLVIMYHRVIDDPALDPFALGMCVRRAHFIEHLDWLRVNCNVLPLSQAIRAQREGRALPPCSVALTFDDGYLDNLEIAAPLLAERGLPATFFVCTGGMDEGVPLWWDRVIGALDATRSASVSGALLGLDQPVDIGGVQRAAGAQRVLQALWALPPDRLMSALEALETALGIDSAPPAPMPARMTAAQVRQLHALGFEIGAHTVRHVDLRNLDCDAIEAELCDGRARLEAILGERVVGFAYPSGFHSESLQARVAALGFDYAVRTDRGLNVMPWPIHALHRVGAPDMPMSDFKRALCGVPPLGSNIRSDARAAS